MNKLFNMFDIHEDMYGEKFILLSNSDIFYLDDETTESLTSITERTTNITRGKNKGLTIYWLGYNV